MGIMECKCAEVAKRPTALVLRSRIKDMKTSGASHLVSSNLTLSVLLPVTLKYPQVYLFLGESVVKPDKSRYVWVYLPSHDDKDRWTAESGKAKAPSLSKFIIDIVENALIDESEIKPRGEIIKELARIKEDNKKLADELKLKNIVLEKYENELERYRGETFLTGDYQGLRKYSKEIIALLKQHGTIDSYRILESLGIDPKDSELVRAVSTELENLEVYGLVSSTKRGWKWHG